MQRRAKRKYGLLVSPTKTDPVGGKESHQVKWECMLKHKLQHEHWGAGESNHTRTPQTVSLSTLFGSKS